MGLTSTAYAQAAEATKAAVDASGIFLQQGVLGAACVFLILAFCGACLVIRKLYLDLQALHGVTADKFGKALAVIEASTLAIVETLGSNQALGTAIAALASALNELSHESEKHDREVRHGLNGVSQGLNGLLVLMEKIPEKVSEKLSALFDRPRSGGSR